MSSPPSPSDRSTAFERLNPEIQRWVWEQGWTALRDAQERAIPALLDAEQDLVISANTAAGKTEAAFLPILTKIAPPQAGLALYISPLKALINDQWERLTVLCERLHLPVIPWHGDISAARKSAFFKRPQGCLLITPESLEGLLLHQGSALKNAFKTLQYIVIDELHAFFGTERGRQLQALLYRLDVLRGASAIRVGLSATLGDMQSACAFLRPQDPTRVTLIESRDAKSELRVLLRCILNQPTQPDSEQSEQDSQTNDALSSEGQIADELYRVLKGSHNLIFANSRQRVEAFADRLRRRCEADGLLNEFWPHHGSLAKSVREETEQALKDKTRPATAVTTSTLELGINIGAVKTVAQLDAAPSVASLRQRLGRSGREAGTAQILRGFCIENAASADSALSDLLHEGLVEMAAQVRLLVKGWYEPPAIASLQLSTLIQQLLSLTAQYGGIRASQAWAVLCESGLFPGISKQEFVALLHELGRREILMQSAEGLLMLAPRGESITERYDFLAAFAAPEEFLVVSHGRTLGRLPIDRPLSPNDYIILAGRRWKVLKCKNDERVIEVTPAAAGKAPMFSGLSSTVHAHVRDEMREILRRTDYLPFLDVTAREALARSRETYRQFSLDTQAIIERNGKLLVLPWDGDKTHDTLTAWFQRSGLSASNQGLVIEVDTKEFSLVHQALKALLENKTLADVDLLPSLLPPTQEKWEWLLPEELFRRQCASRSYDVAGAKNAAERILA